MKPFVEHAIETVKEILRREGSHAPMCFYLRDDELLAIVQYDIPTDSPAFKEQMFATLAAKGVTMGANQYMLVNEVYISKVKDGDKWEYEAPSKDPRRQEAVAITFLDGKSNLDTIVSIPFVKNNLGIEIKDVDVSEGQHLGGVQGDIFHKAIELEQQLSSGMDLKSLVKDQMNRIRQQQDYTPKQSKVGFEPPRNPELN